MNRWMKENFVNSDKDIAVNTKTHIFKRRYKDVYCINGRKKMKGLLKKITVIAVSATMVMGMNFSSVYAEETDKQVKIGVSLDNLDDPFWVGIKKGIDAAAEEIGEDKISLDVQIAQGDANKQNQQIQDMLTAGAEAIVSVYVDKEAIKQSVALCNEEDVPFIYVDRSLESTEDAKVAWGIGTDDLALSTQGWEWMVDYARENGIQLKVLELVGSLTDDNVLKRMDGFEKVMDENSDIVELVQEVPTDFNLEKALAGVKNALQANPDINCIFMHSDYLLAPTVQALQAANRYVPVGEEGHIILMPYSGAQLSLQTIEEGYAEMCFGMDVYNEGYKGIMAAYDFVTGNTDEYDEPVGDAGFIITQDNFEETSKRAYGGLD